MAQALAQETIMDETPRSVSEREEIMEDKADLRIR